MSDAVTACVHCGFCLPSCPTYQELGEEMDSPRGRIYLMKGALEGNLDPAQVQPHIDRCLGCMACETACPSGVRYHELLLPYRARTEGQGHAGSSGAESADQRSSVTAAQIRRPLVERFRRWLMMQTLPYPSRFRFAVRSARIARALRPITPGAIRPLLDLAPEHLPRAERLPARIPAVGPRRARVALLTGCVQRVMEPAINAATADVLSRNGIEVIVPERQGCCGALTWHAGKVEAARGFARQIFRTFPDDVDAIVVNAAGCGSAMKEYPLAFAGEPDEDVASRLAERVVDVAVFLDRAGITPPPSLAAPVRVAYHDACHLCHAQQIHAEPRRLLASIAGLELVELRDGERCCGSAGTYNIDQPDIAASLGRKKAAAVRNTECDIVATGNIGCMVQIRKHLSNAADGPVRRAAITETPDRIDDPAASSDARGERQPEGDVRSAAPHAGRRQSVSAPSVMHTMQVLSLAYAGKLAPSHAHRATARRSSSGSSHRTDQTR